MKCIKESLLFFLVIGFSACEKLDNGYNPSGGNLPTNYVVITNNAISPSSITLVGGNSVTFLNSSSTSHEILSDDLVTIQSGTITPGAYYYWKKDITGTYPFHCSQHPTETGTLILTP